jgi:hypothetical protein
VAAMALLASYLFLIADGRIPARSSEGGKETKEKQKEGKEIAAISDD